MVRRVLQRLLEAVIVLLGVALMIFFMLRVVPGNPVATLMGEHADRATIARMTAELGLDQPLYVQFGRYILGALRGDFGTSYSLGRPVSMLMGNAFGNTLILAALAALFACVSMPVFMVAMILQYVFGYHLHWLPISGASDIRGFILPAIALGWNSAGSVSRLVRSDLLEILQQDYIDTARAKGLTRMGVLVFHALRNALLPVVTMMALQFSSLLSGAVITETVFSINGIGRLAVQAISGRDIPLLEGTALFATAVVILGNLIADMLYAVLDPRVGRREGLE